MGTFGVKRASDEYFCPSTVAFLHIHSHIFVRPVSTSVNSNKKQQHPRRSIKAHYNRYNPRISRFLDREKDDIFGITAGIKEGRREGRKEGNTLPNLLL